MKAHYTIQPWTCLRRRNDDSLIYVDNSSKIIHHPNRSEPLILFTEKDVTQLKVQRD